MKKILVVLVLVVVIIANLSAKELALTKENILETLEGKVNNTEIKEYEKIAKTITKKITKTMISEAYLEMVFESIEKAVNDKRFDEEFMKTFLTYLDYCSKGNVVENFFLFTGSGEIELFANATEVLLSSNNEVFKLLFMYKFQRPYPMALYIGNTKAHETWGTIPADLFSLLKAVE